MFVLVWHICQNWRKAKFQHVVLKTSTVWFVPNYTQACCWKWHIVNRSHWITCLCTAAFSSLLFRCCFISTASHTNSTRVNKQACLNLSEPALYCCWYFKIGVCRTTSALCAVTQKVNGSSHLRPHRCLHMQAQWHAARVSNMLVKYNLNSKPSLHLAC